MWYVIDSTHTLCRFINCMPVMFFNICTSTYHKKMNYNYNYLQFPMHSTTLRSFYCVDDCRWKMSLYPWYILSLHQAVSSIPWYVFSWTRVTRDTHSLRVICTNKLTYFTNIYLFISNIWNTYILNNINLQCNYF